MKYHLTIYPLCATSLCLYSLNTPENQRFSDVLRDFLEKAGSIKQIKTTLIL